MMMISGLDQREQHLWRSVTQHEGDQPDVRGGAEGQVAGSGPFDGPGRQPHQPIGQLLAKSGRGPFAEAVAQVAGAVAE